MRQLIKTLIFVALVVSCTREIVPEPAIDALVRRYNLSFVESTKTELSGSGSTRQVKWNEEDEIKYYTKGNQSSVSTASVSVSGDAAYIDIPRGRNDDFIKAVYGAGYLTGCSSTADCMYVTSPAKNAQSYTSFAQAHLCAAFSADLEDPDLKFHNAVSILKFTSAASISKVVFSGNNGEVITGGSNGSLKIIYSGGALAVEPAQNGGTSVTVQTNGAESEFYIAVLPVQFEKGITVDCYDSNFELIATKKTTNAVNTVSSSGAVRVLNLGSVQDWLDNPLPVAVDLGLSVKWATFNVGATKPEEYGDYFAWGEAEPYYSSQDPLTWKDGKSSGYYWPSYKWGNVSCYNTLTKYGKVDNKTVLDLEDDAAHVNWGGNWRMPTVEEQDELMTKCTWTWTTQNEVNGRLVTGPNGKSIFLPAAGFRNGTDIYYNGAGGYYWSSSLYAFNPGNAYFVLFYYNVNSGSDSRCNGFSVRPVFDDPEVPVSSVSLNSSTLTLTVAESKLLTATVLPSTAINKKVNWSSSNISVATVDSNGKVTGVMAGTARITAVSAGDSSKSTYCEVTVTEPPMIAGHQYVDLGLPSGLKWATMNIGATKPEEYGDYFAWGEIEPVSITYKWWGRSKGGYCTVIKYCTDNTKWDSSAPMDNKTILDAEDDAAYMNWGGKWRMPTNEEWMELRTECTWTWTSQNGVNGRLVSGPNGNSIFLPAAGTSSVDSNGMLIYFLDLKGYYWSSSLYLAYTDSASGIIFDSNKVNGLIGGRSCGYSIRPVFDSKSIIS